MLGLTFSYLEIYKVIVIYCLIYKYTFAILSGELNVTEMLVSMGTTQMDEFYPAVAISALMRILKDSSLSSHHSMVVQVSFPL